MITNYILWIVMGLCVGYLGHYFDINKMKGLEIYLIVGLIMGYAVAFLIHFAIWTVPMGEINFVSIFFGGLITYFGLRVVDYFFHL